MRRSAPSLIAVIAFALGPSAVAQAWPDKPIRLIVNFGTGCAPAGTPRDIVTRLNREVTRIMQTPAVQAALTAMAAEPIAALPQAFAAMLARDRERFGVIVREANIRVE